ncbi:MAG: hypothetical protein CMM59_11035 [Rhodospirillaceae bacterium]|nr:hypothetical protein [Rhodospirillaceae bacterium]|tara:strand:+ start:203 stop:610 length:408 start_codon:yes stop_codon:yes gene_type:complete
MTIEHHVGNLSRHIDQVTEEWQEGYCKLSVELGEQHINRSGAVDGGVFAILIDSAAAYAGTYPKDGEPRADCATISLNVNFAGQPSGRRLIAEGHVRRAGNRVFFASCTVTDEEGNLCAFGDSTFRIFKPRGESP